MNGDLRQAEQMEELAHMMKNTVYEYFHVKGRFQSL